MWEFRILKLGKTRRHVQNNRIGLFSSLHLILDTRRVVVLRLSGATHFDDVYHEEDEVGEREDAMRITTY